LLFVYFLNPHIIPKLAHSSNPLTLTKPNNGVFAYIFMEKLGKWRENVVKMGDEFDRLSYCETNILLYLSQILKHHHFLHETNSRLNSDGFNDSFDGGFYQNNFPLTSLPPRTPFGDGNSDAPTWCISGAQSVHKWCIRKTGV
jgi:hypothetical protein